MTRILIVGEGLAGLTAAALASARRDCSVTVIAAGRGGLSLSHGCIGVWDAREPLKPLSDLPDSHPYSLGGKICLQEGIRSFLQLIKPSGLEYEGTLERNFRLPTALGSILSAAFAPQSLSAGDLGHGASFLVAGLEGFRDYHPEIVAVNLKHLGAAVEGAVTLPLIGGPKSRDAYATDLASLFDDFSWLEESARAWKPRIGTAKNLALPAVIGLLHPVRSLELLQTRLGVPVFEVPTLPPCVPGLRLERALRSHCLAAGVSIVEGATAVGLVDGRSGGKRVAGVVAHSAGGPWEASSDATILATGGILNGGLVAQADGQVQESVFDLPVVHTQDRSAWTAASPWDPHPYSRFGLRVDAAMQPLDRNGRPMFDNLFAIGGLLAGADRAHEGSRQGIDIATAYRAIEVLLG